MKQTVYVSSNFGVSKSFSVDALPGEEEKAQSAALRQAAEYCSAEEAKRPSVPDERTERPMETGG